MPRPKHVVAVTSFKGGCGKTTLTTHTAMAAIQDGYRVAIIDLDPQQTSAEWADGRSDSPVVISAQATRLAKVLEQIADQYDFIVIDTPPSNDSIPGIAAYNADLCIVPSRVQVSDISAVMKTWDKCKATGTPFFVVFNDELLNRRKSISEAMAEKCRSLGVDVSPIVIHNLIAFGESQDVSKTVLETDPDSRAAKEIRALYGWIKNKLGIQPVDQPTTKLLNHTTIQPSI